MRMNVFAIVLVVVSLLSAFANGIFGVAFGRLSDVGRVRDVAGQLEMKCDQLGAEHARLALQVVELRRLAGLLARAREDERPRPAVVVTEDAPSNVEEASAEFSADRGDDGRPDPAEIPLLAPEEWQALIRERSALPRDLKGDVLLTGDVDAILESRRWNPAGRDLDAEERAGLATLLERYRYYARLSPIERFEEYVAPELPRLREAGAFVEYPRDAAPPAIEGVSVSHAEPSDHPGMLRLYYFFPEDYPEVAHQARVEQERGLETFLEIYYRLNGYPEEH